MKELFLKLEENNQVCFRWFVRPNDKTCKSFATHSTSEELRHRTGFSINGNGDLSKQWHGQERTVGMYDMNMDMRQDMDIDRNTEIPTSWLKALSDIAPSTMRMRMSMLLPHVLCFLGPVHKHGDAPKHESSATLASFWGPCICLIKMEDV